MSWDRNFRQGPPRPPSRGFHQQGRSYDYGHGRSSYNAPLRPFQPPPNRFERRYSEEEEEEDDDYEELIPLPEDLTRKFGKLTCELCLCTLPSVKQANMHYEGKQHEKRVVRYLEEWSQATNQKIPNCWLRLVCKRKKNTKLPQGCDEKFCGVCNIVLTSAVVAEQHYAGRSHNSALKLYRGKNGARNIQTNAKSQFVCDICNVVTSCQEHLENHMRGSKHKKVLERLREAESLEMYGGYDEEEQEQEIEIPEYNVIKSSSGDVQYECVYCTWRGRPVDFEAHKEKLTHIAAVEEEARKKADLDDDDDDDDDGGMEYTDVTDLFCKLCNVQLTSKKEVTKHVRSRDHLEEVNLRKKQVMLSLDDQETSVVEEEHKCDLCLMKFPSKSMYDAHLQWKRHVKKLANKIQSQCKKTCELCQMDFYSEEMYNAHLSTKRHRNNEQWLKKKSETSEGSNKLVDEETSSNVTTNISEGNKDDEKPVASNKSGMESNANEKNIGSEGNVNKTMTRDAGGKSVVSDDSGKSIEGKDPVNKTSDNSIGIFECEVCEISVTGKLPFEQHLISTRHILQCSLKQATVSDNKEKTEPAKSTKPAAAPGKLNQPLFCKLCHVTSLTNYQHELHVSSKKHKDAVTKLEVLKYEPKLKTAMSYKPATSQNTSVTDRNSPSHFQENSGKTGNYNKEQLSFRQFDNTVSVDKFNLRNQSVFSEKSHFIQPQREVSNIPTRNNFQQSLKEPNSVTQPFEVSPNVSRHVGPAPYFPSPVTQSQHFAPPATQAQHFTPPATQAQHFTPPATQEQHFAPPANQAQPFAPPATQAPYFAPSASERFEPVPPPVRVIQNPPAVTHVGTANYSGNSTENLPPIRRATYSCKDCGAAFISGVDYKHHAKLCKIKERCEEEKDVPPKGSLPVLHNDHYHCEACDAEYTSYRAFLEHKASAEHEANIEHLREFGKRLRPVRQEKSKPEAGHWLGNERKDRGLHSSKQYECKRCNVAFFSQQSFNRHINSAGHLRKPVSFKHEIITYREEIRRSPPISDRNTRYEREGKSPHKRRNSSSERSSRDYRSRSCDRRRKHMSSDSDSDELDLLPRKKTKRLYECTVCDKIYSSEIEYNEHLKSKNHRSRMCMYECSECAAVFSSKHDLANHMCDLGRIRSIGRSDSDRQLHKLVSDRRSSSEEDNTFLDVDEDFEISKNLLSSHNQPDTSLLSTFSFKRETYEIMSDSHGMPSFNY